MISLFKLLPYTHKLFVRSQKAFILYKKKCEVIHQMPNIFLATCQPCSKCSGFVFTKNSYSFRLVLRTSIYLSAILLLGFNLLISILDKPIKAQRFGSAKHTEVRFLRKYSRTTQ